MNERRLRPHHGLCSLFFEGKGYNERFTWQMAQILREAERGERFRLTTAADEICAQCPNRRGESCSGAHALHYDHLVLQKTGFSAGDLVTLAELQSAVERQILQTGQLDEVCGSCTWADLCQRRWRERQT